MDPAGALALLEDVSFLAAAGTVGAAVAVGAVSRLTGRSGGRPPAGPVVLGAVVVGAGVQGSPSLLAVVVAILAGAVAGAPPWVRSELRFPAALAASLVVAAVADPVTGWEVVVVSLAAAVALSFAAGMAAADPVPPGHASAGHASAGGASGSVAATWSLAIVSAGVFLCVPETGHARLVAAAGGLALVGVLFGALRPIGPMSAGAWAALLGWVVLTEGWARPGAVVGGAACLVAVALPALSRRVALPALSRRVAPSGQARSWVGPAVLVPVVAVCSRVAGLRTEPAEAGVLAAIALVAGVVGVWALHRSSRPSSPARGPAQTGGGADHNGDPVPLSPRSPR